MQTFMTKIKDKFNKCGWKTILKLLLQLLHLAWESISRMSDLLFIILYRNHFKIIIKKAEEQEEMDCQLNVYFFIREVIEQHFKQ
jgi:hypothetical protein